MLVMKIFLSPWMVDRALARTHGLVLVLKMFLGTWTGVGFCRFPSLPGWLTLHLARVHHTWTDVGTEVDPPYLGG